MCNLIIESSRLISRMPYETNADTQKSLSREIKALKSRCMDAYSVIENNIQMEMRTITADNVVDKTASYIEGVRNHVENSNVPIRTEDNLVTSELLADIKQQRLYVEELSAFTKGAIHDIDNEIIRLENQIKIAKEAKSRPRQTTREIQSEHAQRAKQRFLTMKSELHDLIKALFPEFSDKMFDILAKLMQLKMNGTADSYMHVTMENYTIVQLLKDMDIVTTNPYNETEVKLAY